MGFNEGDRLAGRLGLGDFPLRRLSYLPAGVDDRDPVGQVDLAQVKSVQDGCSGVGSSASLGAMTMTPVKVTSRFAARISVMNFEDHRCGRLVTTRP